MDAIDFLHGWCVLTVLLVNLIDVAQSGVPPEYCLHRLNTSNCNGPPTPVVYYYKPGSRCEVAIWRGCPTLNKFRDEVICSHICIARLAHWSSEEQDLLMLKENKTESAEGEQEDGIQDWENELESVLPEEIEIIDNILDGVGNDTKIKKLKFHGDESTAATEATAEKATEESALLDGPHEEASAEETTEEATTEVVTVATTTEDPDEDGDPDEVITP